MAIITPETPLLWDLICLELSSQFQWPRSMELNQTNLIAGLIGLIIFPPSEDIPAPPGIPPGAILPPGITPPAGEPPTTAWGDVIPPSILNPPIAPPGGVMPGPGPETAPANQANLKGAKTLTYEVDIISAIADGWIRNQAAGTWAQVRGATDGTRADDNDSQHLNAMNVDNNVTGGSPYTIYRSFFFFDLSSIPAGATITACILKLGGYGSAESNVCAQKGTQADTLSTADYDAFTGDEFSHVAWAVKDPLAGSWNEITFNAAGLAYIQAMIGSVARICCREYSHDFLNVDPGNMESYANGTYYADNATEERRPRLAITYEA